MNYHQNFEVSDGFSPEFCFANVDPTLSLATSSIPDTVKNIEFELYVEMESSKPLFINIFSSNVKFGQFVNISICQNFML